MDKPQSLSVRDYLIRKLAVSLRVHEKTIEAVVAHQFNEANVALRSNDSIEISGFGKFLFNKNKAVKKMEKYMNQKAWWERFLLNPDITEKKREKAHTVIASLSQHIEALKPKIYDVELFANSGGMEKQVDSSSTSEGADRSNISTENPDM
jgi:nucleoid DNA-binding protein